MASGEPVASRTSSQTTASEPVAARTRQALGSSPEMSAFADVKDDKTLNEWLHEIAFVTSTMSDPDVCTMPDLWQKVSVKSQEWILQTTIPQWLMMSHSELWWQE